MKHRFLLPVAFAAATTSPVAAQLIGTENFAYADGAVANRTGGTGFDYNNVTKVHTLTASDWDNTAGTPAVTAGVLTTNNSGAKREYNGPTEGAGGGDGDETERAGAVRAAGRVFYRFTITRGPGTTWAGASSYDFGSERVFFGTPGGNGASGQLEFGCAISGGATYRTGVAADNATHTCVALLDFDRDKVALWVDPTVTDYYDPVDGSNSADASGAFTGTNWSTAVRLASSASTTWDDLSIALDPVSVGLKNHLDADNDGLPASFEALYGLNDGDDGTVDPNNGPSGDPDGDTVTNAVEFADGTFPNAADTDGDGLNDSQEKAAGTNPLLTDSDGDALSDADEIGTHSTNPILSDSDGGGTADSTELALGTLPRAGNAADDPDTGGNPDLVALDFFDDYPDGLIGGGSQGTGWDYDNSALGETFLGHTTMASSWINFAGTPQVLGGVVFTRENSVRRPFHGGSARPAAVVGETSGYWRGDAAATGINGSDVLYIKVNIVRQTGATWSGLSLFDFDAEKVFLGVPNGANPVSGVREYGVEQTVGLLTAYSGVPAIENIAATLVARYNFATSRVDLWVNPNLAAPEGSSAILATLNVTPAQMRATSLRLGSGGTGSTGWDQLVVGTTWDALDSLPSDSDGDGMPDAYELANGLDPDFNDAALDLDSDGSSNYAEYIATSNPQVGDTDSDGLPDGAETTASTSPLNPDTDGDGLSDGAEVNTHGSSPLLVDTDSDGQTDGAEVQGTSGNTSNPVNPADTIGAPLALIGIDSFAYADGPVAGLAGGTYFDYENWFFNGPFVGHTSFPSDWDGTANVTAGHLVTQENYAFRDFNGPEEGGGSNGSPTGARMGAVNEDANFDRSVVYFKATLTRRAGAQFSVFGPDDFDAERLAFGVVDNGGTPQWGIREGAAATTDNGTLPVTPGQTYTVVGKLDFTGDLLSLWINPDLGTNEAANPTRVTRAYTGDNWASGLRLGSTGTGDTEWDDIVVANTWQQLIGEPGLPIQLSVAGWNPGTGTLSLTATGIPATGTYHLRSSADLLTFLPLDPAFNFDSTTPQPFLIPANPATVPRLFYRAGKGASPAP